MRILGVLAVVGLAGCGLLGGTAYLGNGPALDLDLGTVTEPANVAPAPLLATLERELQRNLATLRKVGDPPPYHVTYAVTETHGVRLAASFGALYKSTEWHRRRLDVDVRVGSPRLDNTHLPRSRTARTGDSFPGYDAFLPLSDDPGALSNALRLRTDAAYRNAVRRFGAVTAQRQVEVTEKDEPADFSLEKATVRHLAPASIDVDRQLWTERLRRYSLPFKEHPEIDPSGVQLDVLAITRYVVTSEGTSLQLPSVHVRLSARGQIVADDGARLQRSDSIDGRSLDVLSNETEIRRRVAGVIDDLLALRDAPVAEPYTGPAILEGRAAAVFFHETFGHRVEGHRQKGHKEGQTFAKKIGKRVMPDFISVFDDPTIDTLDGTELSGSYRFDDEGVRSRRVTLVERGTLRGFLLSRSPVSGFAHSNGHGRRQPGLAVVARQANLVVDPLRTTTSANLKRALLREIRRQGKPYGLRFHEISGGFTFTQRSMPQAFKVLPVMVYRVYPDGHEELVRGADFEGTPLVSLSRIIAAGNDVQTFNGYCGGESGYVPVSASSPSLLVEQIEVSRQQAAQERARILPPPPLLDAGTEVTR